MSNSLQQIPLQLLPANPYGLKYFVAHSGVAEAFAILEHAVAKVLDDSSFFQAVYIFGPAGSGKTHLVNAFKSELLEKGYPESKLLTISLDDHLLENGQVDDTKVPGMVSEFEAKRSAGGCIFLHCSKSPQEITVNPHLLSRLLFGAVVEIRLPTEEELEPILRSLLERHNLCLSERTLNYVLARLPLNPLNFDSIFAQINEVSLERNKPAGPGIAREVVNLQHKP